MLVNGIGSQRIEDTKDDNNEICMDNTIEIYRSQDGSIQLNVKLENETVWLTQSQRAELFGVDRTSIVRHIRNIYKSEELNEISTCAKNAQVRKEGHRKIPHYNLDMIISVGYRVTTNEPFHTTYENAMEAIKPVVQRRQQAHRSHALPLVPQQQPCTLCRRWP